MCVGLCVIDCDLDMAVYVCVGACVVAGSLASAGVVGGACLDVCG